MVLSGDWNNFFGNFASFFGGFGGRVGVFEGLFWREIGVLLIQIIDLQIISVLYFF